MLYECLFVLVGSRLLCLISFTAWYTHMRSHTHAGILYGAFIDSIHFLSMRSIPVSTNLHSQHFSLTTNQPHNITHAEYYLSPLKNTTKIHTCDLSGSGYKTSGYVCSMWHWGSSRDGEIMDGLAPRYGLLSLGLGSVLWLFWLYFLGFLKHFFCSMRGYMSWMLCSKSF